MNSRLTRTLRGVSTAFELTSWNAGTEIEKALGFKTTVRDPFCPQSRTRVRSVRGSAPAEATGISIRTPVDTIVANSRIVFSFDRHRERVDPSRGGILRQAVRPTGSVDWPPTRSCGFSHLRRR